MQNEIYRENLQGSISIVVTQEINFCALWTSGQFIKQGPREQILREAITITDDAIKDGYKRIDD